MQNKDNQNLDLEQFDNSNEHALIFHLNQISDFRKSKGRLHRLLDCLMIIIWGFMSGLPTMREIARSARIKDERDSVFSDSLNLTHGVPSHDTFSRIMRSLDKDALDTAFLNWINANLDGVGFHLAIDGKAIKASRDAKGGHRKPPYIINVVETSTKTVIAQLEIKVKRSEITGIPAIIRALNEKYPGLIEGMTISIDALAMNDNTIQACEEANASLIAPIKKNQKTLLEDASFLINSAIEEARQSHLKGLDNRFGSSLSFVVQAKGGVYDLDFDHPLFPTDPKKEHGRLERRVYAAYVLDEDERLDGFKDIDTIIKVVRYREEIRKEGCERKFSVETNYYQCTAPIDSTESEETISDHWIVETCNYYLDCNIGEDGSTATKKAALSNLAIMRRAALNLLNSTSALDRFSSLKDKQAFCRENPDIVFDVIFGNRQLKQS